MSWKLHSKTITARVAIWHPGSAQACSPYRPESRFVLTERAPTPCRARDHARASADWCMASIVRSSACADIVHSCDAIMMWIATLLQQQKIGTRTPQKHECPTSWPGHALARAATGERRLPVHARGRAATAGRRIRVYPQAGTTGSDAVVVIESIPVGSCSIGLSRRAVA